MIHLDNCILIDALTGPRRSLPALRAVISDGIRVGVSSLVLYEWRRGPRRDEELALETLLLDETAVTAFGPSEAKMAADLYRSVRRPRGRELDIAIAACAMTRGAQLWTLNVDDFRDIAGLELHSA